MKKLMTLAVAAITATVSHAADTETIGTYTYNYIDNGDGMVTLSCYDEMTVYTRRNEIEWFCDVVEGGAIITGCAETLSGTVSIPSRVTVEEDDGNGGVVEVAYPVVAIDEDAFFCEDGMTAVVIPASVTSIGDGAFEGCDGLEHVEFEGGMESIEMDVVSAFYETPWLFAYLASFNPPSNDDFANATVISGESGNVVGTNLGATLESNEEPCCGEECLGSVWWKWVAPASGKVEFSTRGSSFGASLAIYEIDDPDNPAGVANLAEVESCDYYCDRTSRLTFDAEGDKVYWIAVNGYGIGDIVLSWGAPEYYEGTVVVYEDKGTVEAVENGYVVTANAGETLSDGDIEVWSTLQDSPVEVTAGYTIVIAQDGSLATVSLAVPSVSRIVDDAQRDADDKSGFLVDPGKVTVSAAPTPDASKGEILGALPVDAVPGLWYQASWGGSLDTMTEGEKVQASSSALYLGVIKQTGDKGFYKLSVSAK